MKGFAITLIIMMTIVGLGSTAQSGFTSAEIVQLKELLAKFNAKSIASGSRGLQAPAITANQNVSVGVTANKKTATPLKPKTRTSVIVRLPVQAKASTLKKTNKISMRMKKLAAKIAEKKRSAKIAKTLKPSKHVNPKIMVHVITSLSSNSKRKAIHAKNMINQKKIMLKESAAAVKAAQALQKKTQNVVKTQNKAIYKKAELTMKIQKKVSADLLDKAQKLHQKELSLGAALKKLEASKEAAILSKNGKKFSDSNKGVNIHTKLVHETRTKLKSVENAILISMGQLKDAMSTINKHVGSSLYFTPLAKPTWFKKASVVENKYRLMLVSTIQTLAKTQALYTASVDHTDKMSLALKAKTAAAIVSLKKDIEFLFKQFLKASERVYSLSAKFPWIYKTAKQRAYALANNKVPNLLTKNVKKSILTKRKQIAVMKLASKALTKKATALKVQVKGTRKSHQKIAEKAKKAEIKADQVLKTLKKAAPSAKGVTVAKLVQKKTGKKVSVGSKFVVNSKTSKKVAISGKKIPMTVAQKKMSMEMKHRESLQVKVLKRNKAKVLKLQKKSAKAEKALASKQTVANLSAARLAKLEAEEKLFETKQSELKKRMTALSSQINKIKNDDVNYAKIQTKTTKPGAAQKSANNTKGKFVAFKKRLAKWEKKASTLKAGPKTDKTIKLLNFKIATGHSRLSHLETDMKKAALALSKTPAAIAKANKIAHKKAAGTYKVGFKAPTTITKAVVKNTNKAVLKIQKTAIPTASPTAIPTAATTAATTATVAPVITVIPAKRITVAAAPKITVKETQPTKASQALKELSLIEGEFFAGGIEQEIMGATGNM